MRPITKTQGLGGFVNNRNRIFIEETNYGRLSKIDTNKNKFLWTYINKANKNSYNYLMSWSRRIENIDPSINNNLFVSCKPKIND